MPAADDETVSRPDNDPTLPTDRRVLGTISDRYELVSEIGRGGFGAVYRARDKMLQRDVAIKVVTGDASPDARERFAREARATARLHHPNIVTVHDAGSEGNVFYLVLELVDGVSIASLARAKIDPERTLFILRQVLSALVAAHGAGIVHRDIKPANILISAGDVVKVADFGIARIAGESPLTVAGGFIGTPRYMAPEQIEGGEIGPAADIFAVGLVVYELLTGARPFRGETVPELAANLARGQWVKPDDATIARAPRLWSAVERMLESDPAKRPSAAELLAMLEGKPLRPRRRRMALLFVVLLAIAIAVAVVISQRPSAPAAPKSTTARVALRRVTADDVLAFLQPRGAPPAPVTLRPIDRSRLQIEGPREEVAQAVAAAQIVDGLSGYRFAAEPNLFTGPASSTRRISCSGRFVAADFLSLIAHAASWPLVQDISVRKAAAALVPVSATEAPWDEVARNLIDGLDLNLWRNGNVWILESQERRREREKTLPRSWVSWRMENRKDTAAVAAALRPLLSDRSALAVLPPDDRFVLADTAERVEQIMEVVAQMDGTPAAARSSAGSPPVYGGEPITLNLRDADLVEALQLFPKLTGLSVVVDPGVAGTVSVDFEDVPWDNAFEAILRSQGLTYRMEGTVLRVLPETKRLSGPAVVESLRLAHVKPTFFRAFAAALAPDVEIVLMDDASATIVLRGTQPAVKSLASTIRKLDDANGKRE